MKRMLLICVLAGVIIGVGNNAYAQKKRITREDGKVYIIDYDGELRWVEPAYADEKEARFKKAMEAVKEMDFHFGDIDWFGKWSNAAKRQSWSDWAFDKTWGRMKAEAGEGWFSGVNEKITMIYRLLIVSLIAFAALCGLGIIRRIVGK
jgi:hypothetical protein